MFQISATKIDDCLPPGFHSARHRPLGLPPRGDGYAGTHACFNGSGSGHSRPASPLCRRPVGELHHAGPVY